MNRTRLLFTLGMFAVAPAATCETLYQSWKASKFTPAELADPLVSGDEADPDGDGIVNCLEYACGTEPKVSDPRQAPFELQIIELGGGEQRARLAVKRRTNEPSVVYLLEASDDLGAGTIWRSGPLEFDELGVASLDYEFEQVTLEDLTLVAGTAHRFFRLGIVKDDTDTDGDGLPDVFEQQLIDRDPTTE